MGQSRRLWDKGAPLNERIHRFTVGDDPIHDRELLPWDCVGSAAHAKMLQRIGILTSEELRSLLTALTQIHASAERGEIEIPSELEDCHSTLEHLLIERCGEAGKKIHTGRSRNDQIVLVTRLYMRDALLRLMQHTAEIVSALLEKNDTIGDLPLPGYTHMQPAMPSSVGLWIHAWVEALGESLADAQQLLASLNRNPLGAGAGFGVSLPLDRAYVAKLLAFDGVQESVIDVQNSRGRYERKLLFWVSEVGATIEKLASDLLLFATKEYGFVKLPEAYTTGSSLMPQKRNPDVLELMRASASTIRGALAEVTGVTTKLPSSYHRDFQLSKGPLLRGIRVADELLSIMPTLITGLTFDSTRLAEVMYPELYATYAALDAARSGTPFRDAYQAIAQKSFAALQSEYANSFGPIAQAAATNLATHRITLRAWQDRQRTLTERFKKAIGDLVF